MPPVISVENLSKAYRIGLKEEIPDTLVGAATKVLKSPLRNFNRLRRLNTFTTPSPNSDLPSPNSDIVWALKDVSFEVQEGEVLGIIGRNGAGKSTLLKVLSRITDPTSGRAVIRGRVSSLLEVGTGFHPELTGRENIYMNGTILGLTKREIDRKFDEIVDFSGVERFLDTPVKRYSSGMTVRLAFSVAAHLEPEILVIDEVLAVGDAQFQKRCLGKMGDVANSGRTVLFVSHNLASVQNLCRRAIHLSRGQIVADGAVSGVIPHYLNSSQERPSALPGVLATGMDGHLKLLSLQFDDESGTRVNHVLCGQNVILSFTLRSTLSLDRLTLLLAINDRLERRIAQLNSSIAGYDFDMPCGTRHFRCRIPRLPLSPGGYYLDLKVLANKERLLVARNVLQLSVENGDFFRSGRLPTDPRWAGICQVWHTWESAE